MTEEMSYQQVFDLMPAYVLGALDPDEMLAVDEYIEQHRSLLERVGQLDVAMAHLASAAPPDAAVVRVQKTLLTRIRADLEEEKAAARPAPAQPISPRSPAQPGPATGRQQKHASPFLRPRRTGAPPRPLFPEATRSRPLMPWLWGAAAAAVAAVVLVVVALSFVDLQRQVVDLRAQAAARAREIEALNQQIADLQQRLVEGEQQVALFTEADRVIPVAGTDEAPAIRGAFYQRDNEGVLVVRGLAPLPAGQSYQLWLIPADGAPTPSALLGGQNAAVRQVVEIPAEASAFATVGISIEPATGSQAPTGPIVALGQT
jgi:anti-sigma-K factor RskA